MNPCNFNGTHAISSEILQSYSVTLKWFIITITIFFVSVKPSITVFLFAFCSMKFTTNQYKHLLLYFENTWKVVYMSVTVYLVFIITSVGTVGTTGGGKWVLHPPLFGDGVRDDQPLLCASLPTISCLFYMCCVKC